MDLYTHWIRRRAWRGWAALMLVAVVAHCGVLQGQSPAPPALAPLPMDGWGPANRKVAGLKAEQRATVGFPAAQRTALEFESRQSMPAGLYQLELTLCPSHVADEIAWHGGLVVKVDGEEAMRLEGIYFSRVHEPEVCTLQIVHRRSGPLRLELAADLDPEVFSKALVRSKLAQGDGPKDAGPSPSPSKPKVPLDDDLVSELTMGLRPTSHFYYLIDAARLAPLSRTARVAEVTVDKIRYLPGESLHGSATLEPLSGEAKGTLRIFLEHDVAARELVKELPVALAGEAKELKFEFSLPERELGYALVAQYVSDDGRDRSEAAEYFNIAENFNRVAIFGSLAGGHGGTFSKPEAMQAACRALQKTYANAVEYFAWAEEDMLEMSPESDVWYSGQTCYRINKAGLQRLIAESHNRGIASVTYGKFIMSGYLGWKTAWDLPRDHQRQFFFPVGTWEGVNVRVLDRFRFREFAAYEHSVPTGGLLNPWWQAFLPVNPDPTPRMVRMAAEETLRSIDMFGWDGIRWDGQPRAGGPTGGSGGQFDYQAARKTQTLVRYFKDIVAEKYPNFGHGYNYLLVQEKPNYDWAREDFELDELCRGGGLLMNESIGNTTAGRTFDFLARNIQVEGDLARERGGLLLGISYASDPRDTMVECILYFAGGCRPMQGTAKSPIFNRYGTRYSRYTFDETLRRLDRPEAVLKPLTETKLWWQPFVYETQEKSGLRQLVVNLINVPLQKKTRGNQADLPVEWEMLAGTEPVAFALTLPEGYRATGARLIDPFTLEVTPAEMKNDQVQIPSVAMWRVLIVDMDRQPDAKLLAERFGPPKTFGVPRPGLDVERTPPVVLDVKLPVDELERRGDWPRSKSRFDESPEIAALLSPERDAALLKIKAKEENSAEAQLGGWWKGASLPADLKLRDKRPALGNLAPRHNGRFDVFLARGVMAHRLDLAAAAARLPAVALRQATLAGSISVNYWLEGNIDPQSLADYDLVIYTDIPHGAIGPANCYALVDYVKSGGAVLFTGGQYSFGKGGYAWTVLDRDLLPVQIVENIDTRIAREPLPLEPGPDFAELRVEAEFAEQPSLWVFNQVALRPASDVKVFLKSGNRPILVGWQLGAGRVACLLAAPMGQGTDGNVMFHDWKDWPEVTAAVMRWLAPTALEPAPQPKLPTPEQLAALVGKVQKEQGNAALDDLLDGGQSKSPASSLAPDGALSGGAKPLDEKTLAERLAVIDTLLAVRRPDAALVLADQLVDVPNLPDDVRDRILVALAEQPSPQFVSAAQRAMASRNVPLRGAGYALLSLAAGPEFAVLASDGVPKATAEKIELDRYLALAVALYPKKDLIDVGRGRLARWAEQEETKKSAYTGGGEFSMASPRVPCLDSETLVQRAGWLAYLARFDPDAYGAQFAHEWALLAQYQEYCNITEAGIWSSLRNATVAQRATARLEVAQVQELRRMLGKLRAFTQPRLDWLLAKHPELVGKGFAQAHYRLEAEAGADYLARQPVAVARPALERLRDATHPVWKRFAEARLASEP